MGTDSYPAKSFWTVGGIQAPIFHQFPNHEPKKARYAGNDPNRNGQGNLPVDPHGFQFLSERDDQHEHEFVPDGNGGKVFDRVDLGLNKDNQDKAEQSHERHKDHG